MSARLACHDCVEFLAAGVLEPHRRVRPSREMAVATYLQRTLEKLGAHTRIEALARAGELGIL